MSEKIQDMPLRIDAIQAQYENLVGDRPRTTDLIPVLTALLEEVEETIAGTSAMDPLSQAEAVSQLTVYRDQYRAEIKALSRVDAQLPTDPTEKRVAMWGNALYGAYRRHFAGHPRETRDPGLLDELLRTMREMSLLMDNLPPATIPTRREQLQAVLEQNQELFEEELAQIRAAQTNGNLDEQVNHLALAANNIFTIYTQHFSGKPRHTRRPGLLRRAISSLEYTLGHMNRVQAEDDSFAMNIQNIGVIKERLATYRQELQAIESIRQNTKLEQIMGGLADEANQFFSMYREKFADQDRATRDLSVLGEACDQLLEIAFQMRDLEQTSGHEMNRKNLEIVLQNLSLYDHEYVHIEKARMN